MGGSNNRKVAEKVFQAAKQHCHLHKALEGGETEVGPVYLEIG